MQAETQPIDATALTFDEVWASFVCTNSWNAT